MGLMRLGHRHVISQEQAAQIPFLLFLPAQGCRKEEPTIILSFLSLFGAHDRRPAVLASGASMHVCARARACVCVCVCVAVPLLSVTCTTGV